jgi:hypothetical protein
MVVTGLWITENLRSFLKMAVGLSSMVAVGYLKPMPVFRIESTASS